MSYAIAVPQAIKNEIRSWELSIDAEDLLYQTLDEEFGKKGPDFQMVMGPSVFTILFQDPLIAGITHRCKFFLSGGPELFYVMNCFHDYGESWGDPDAPD